MPLSVEEILAHLTPFTPELPPGEPPSYTKSFKIVAVSTTPKQVAAGNAKRVFLLIVNNDSQDGYVWPDASLSVGNGITIPGNGGAFFSQQVGNIDAATDPMFWVSQQAASVAVIEIATV